MITRPITRPMTLPLARAITAQFGGWSPRALFSSGEQGVWYDPNDLSTLFQDSAGTIPVTAAGQPVGLMLDKRLGLVRGSERVTNGDFSSGTAGWLSVGSAGLAAVDGALQITAPGTVNPGARQVVATTAGTFYEIKCSFKSGNIANGIPRLYVAGVTVASGTAGAGITTELRGVFAATGSSQAIDAVFAGGAVSGEGSVDNISVRELPGNHAFQATAASRPTLRQNATTGAYYLESDGSDDWMQTNSINFAATDKVTVFAGVRKLSDATGSILCELSATIGSNNGAFRLSAPVTMAGEYSFASRGSATGAANSGAVGVPHDAVLRGVGVIGSDRSEVYVNGLLAGYSATDQGTGNYGNHPLYLFRRGGTTLPFNGHFYGLTIVGRLCTVAEIVNMERLLARNVGVSLA